MKMFLQRKEDVQPEWFVVNAEGQTLGRMASRIALILQGKHRPTYTPHVDTGDCVVVVNAGKIKLTGRKMDQKEYYSHSGYPGGLTTRPIKRVLREKPEFVVRNAVRLMLPKTKLGRQMFKKLKVYAGTEHPHAAQQPVDLDLTTFQKVQSF